jgi:predicted Zn-dependent protease
MVPGMTSSDANCISEHRDDYGYVWSYEHTPDEPHDTFVSAIMIAGDVAAEEAAKDRKTYVVALMNGPSVAVFALPFGHPMIVNRALSVVYQFTPDGRCIRSPKPWKN